MKRFSLASMIPVLALGMTLIGLNGCGKSVDLNNPSTQSPHAGPTPPTGGGGGDHPTPPPPNSSCAEADREHWLFTQPDETVNRSVDLLIVLDTSPSLDIERAKIAATLPAFVGQINSAQDYRIAVMLAHGGASSRSGRLYSASGVPLVLDSTTMNPSSIQSYLAKDLSNPPRDLDEANGEMLMYSSLKSTSGSYLTTIQKQGFFRNTAALSVIFVTDENDVCFEPQLNGYTKFPDFVPSNGGLEMIAYKRYCEPMMGGNPARFPDLTLNAFKQLKGDLPLALGGIVHIDPAKVPPAINGSEDAIGHGIIELVHKTLNGVLFDVEERDYSTGLAALGNIVDHQLRLTTSFALLGASPFDPTTLQVSVDGNRVVYEFDATDAKVNIAATSAGHALSQIDISACKTNVKSSK